MKKYAVQTTYYVTPKEVHRKLFSLAEESNVLDLKDKEYYFEFNSDDVKLETFKSKVKKCLLGNDQVLKPPTTVLIKRKTSPGKRVLLAF